MRNFYRCRTCLATHASEALILNLHCACGAKVEHIGALNHETKRLETTHTVSKCDSRCTSAVGPKCDCPCLGKYHGSGAVHLITRDAGKPPVIQGAQLAVAKEWRAAVKTHRAKVETAAPGFYAGNWVPASQYAEAKNLIDRLLHAKTLVSHRGRMAALDAFNTPTAGPTRPLGKPRTEATAYLGFAVDDR